ncbi:hypothetical protein [Novosphingobium huizhouense]|uniref:hypothetical protein n=1 Tax=Novosphingobium huizhouense TaxID=2866625 RepID=UPI001CD87701|nr:hypothetical protein [Novosphingobium huizhouense]
MLAVLASLVIAGAGFAAVASMLLTVRSQKGALARLVGEMRSLEQDRVFLVHMTGEARPASPLSFARLRRTPQRAVRRATAPLPQRAAA